MTRLLHISASPRGADAVSLMAAAQFIAALPAGVSTKHIDLFERDLPDVTAEMTSAKMKFVMGVELTAEESQQWAGIIEMVEEFQAADHYLLTIPMWNFTIPYKLKHYIDLITHPGLTFTSDANGPRGLVSGGATLLYARGGDYSPKDGKPDPFDFQSPYMKAWLTMIGLGPVSEILVQQTMMGPDAAIAAAEDQINAAAARVIK